MGPPKKKSLNKRFLSEVSSDIEVRNSNKNLQQVTRKRKLSHKLGPQWSKEELQQFYKAYRQYGTNWKKVAAKVHNRSEEMVEAIYNRSKAYLSLPDGIATAFGFIAMITDDYSTLEVSDPEESNEVLRMHGKPQRKRPIQFTVSENLKQSYLNKPTDGCLALLKKLRLDGGQPRAVGKRTPRFPVSYISKKDDRESYESPKKKDQESDLDGIDDDGAHVAALALAEAAQRGGSSQVSQNIKWSTIQGWDRMFPQPEPNQCKVHDDSVSEDWMQGSVRSRGVDIGSCARNSRAFVDIGVVEECQKGKIYKKKVKSEEIENSLSAGSGDGGEACSSTEEGQKVGTLRGRDIIAVSNAKIDEALRDQMKRSKKLFSRDEFSALDALQTLAQVSLLESESFAQLNEGRTMSGLHDKHTIPEATSTSHNRDKIKLTRKKEKVNYAVGGVGSTTSRKFKLRRHSPTYAKPVSEATQHSLSINDNTINRKRQFLVSKVSNAETAVDVNLSKPLKSEALDEDNVPVIKGKHTSQISAPPSQLHVVGVVESGPVTGDQKSAASGLAVSTAQAPVASQAISQTVKRSRRKVNLKSASIQKERPSSENIMNYQANKDSISLKDRELNLKERLLLCLSSHLVNRWCRFEWFYSAIDYPWFAKREFVEYLNHVGLGHIPRLTRVEWGVIRSSLGKPRRFSEHFLHEEREKLKQYRESVRKHYTELRTGIREGLPRDLARPISVGQRVIGIHPKTRELHDGCVLTVDHDRCRVQFDRPEIGVEFVKDIDCMPLDPLENMPEALRRPKFSVIPAELQVNGHSNAGGFTSSGCLENVHSPMRTLVKQAQLETNHVVPQPKAVPMDMGNVQVVTCSQPAAIRPITHLQAKEAEMQRALDKKAFSALPNGRQHSSYSGNTPPYWPKSSAKSGFHSSLPSSCGGFFVPQESGSTVVEIVEGSRLKAHMMVEAAVQAFSCMKEGDDAFVRIREALDFMDLSQTATESRGHVIWPPGQVNGSLQHHNQSIPDTTEPQCNCSAFKPNLHDNDNKTEAAIITELVTTCVATLLMIQTCTEGQYPPSDVAQVINHAVGSLHPCSPRNLPIYREIQLCMGRIRSQILALIPA